ncbi:MAG: transposase family protein [Actinomycetota bacterium]|nr:transposase family protein [Actinomycetota bacterium]
MSQVQFGELLRRVEELVTWDKGVGRPRGLTLAQGLKATLMYFKNNITEEVIAELLFVSQSVISETISTLEGVIVKALKDFEPDLAEAAEGLAGRVAVIDGSLHPCWSWKDKKDLWSGKHKETGHQHQYVCDLAGNLRYISDPLPGKTHDAKAFRDLQLDHHFNESNAFVIGLVIHLQLLSAYPYPPSSPRPRATNRCVQHSTTPYPRRRERIAAGWVAF